MYEGPALFRSEQDGLWYTCRHEICQRMLLDNRLGHDEERMFRRPGGMDEEQRRRLQEALARGRRQGFSMLTENPPDHTRLRRLVSKAFTFRRVEALRPRIIELTDAYLEGMTAGHAVDVMAELAFPLPVSVIGELVGVPPRDRERFRPLLGDGLLADRPDPSPEELKRAERSLDEMERYLTDLIAERRVRPREDMLSALIAVREEEEERLSENELVATMFLLFLAGFVTTTNLIGNGLLTLFRHRDQMERLWA